jgi:two-component system sensor histidine kinase UhpB
MSLRLRVVLAIAFVLVLSSALGTALAGWQAGQALREELQAALAGGRQTVLSAIGDLPRSGDQARDLRALIATFDGNRHLQASLYAADGRRFMTSTPIPVRPAPDWFAALFHPPVAPVRIQPPAPGYGPLVLSPIYANDVAATWAEFLDLAAVLTASVAVGSILLWLTIGRAIAPLAEFSRAFARIGSGDYGASVNPKGPLELVRLGAAVNEMARRLGAMQARNQGLESQLRTLQDEERADLARDLHDEIGPHLFAANVDATMAEGLMATGETEEAVGRVRAIRAGVGHMQRLVRDILGRLRPAELIELGLTAAIGELAAFWRARHPAITFDVSLPKDDTLIAGELHETVYRVVQEGLTNAVRHGHPSRIEVEITLAADGEVVTRVTDDGQGAGEAEGAGFGLIGMRERVAAAGGSLAVERGRPTGGWSLTARLPADGSTTGVAA